MIIFQTMYKMNLNLHAVKGMEDSEGDMSYWECASRATGQQKVTLANGNQQHGQ